MRALEGPADVEGKERKDKKLDVSGGLDKELT